MDSVFLQIGVLPRLGTLPLKEARSTSAGATTFLRHEEESAEARLYT
jgi:hypothetical protein